MVSARAIDPHFLSDRRLCFSLPYGSVLIEHEHLPLGQPCHQEIPQPFTADFFRLLPRSGMKQHHPAVTELALFAEADVAWLGWCLDPPIGAKIEPGRRNEKGIGRPSALALWQLPREG